jgi:hypothetical protein
MSTLSRSVLQRLPQVKKNHVLEKLLEQRVMIYVSNSAADGMTFYRCSVEELDRALEREFRPQVTASVNDYLAMFRRKFPGCDISYKEIDGRRMICVDWSLEKQAQEYEEP